MFFFLCFKSKKFTHKETYQLSKYLNMTIHLTVVCKLSLMIDNFQMFFNPNSEWIFTFERFQNIKILFNILLNMSVILYMQKKIGDYFKLFSDHHNIKFFFGLNIICNVSSGFLGLIILQLILASSLLKQSFQYMEFFIQLLEFFYFFFLFLYFLVFQENLDRKLFRRVIVFVFLSSIFLIKGFISVLKPNKYYINL